MNAMTDNHGRHTKVTCRQDSEAKEKIAKDVLFPTFSLFGFDLFIISSEHNFTPALLSARLRAFHVSRASYAK